MPFRQVAHPGRSHVLGGGWIRDKASTCPWRDYQAYALVYLAAGSGSFQDAGSPVQTVEAGDMLVLFPGLPHTYSPRSRGAWTEVWVGFHGPVFTALETDGLLDRTRSLRRLGLHHDLFTRFEGLIAAIAAGRDDRHLVAAVHSLVVSIDDRGDQDEALDQAQARLLTNLSLPVDLADIANELGLSYDTLRRRWQARHGMSPGRWRLLRRIEVVKGLLTEGTSLEDAAEATGFCDRGFLTRQFRREVGMTPGAWRRHILGE